MFTNVARSLSVIAIAFLISCSSRPGVDPIGQHYFDAPHVNGIWLYNADGVAIGSWGKPYVPPRYYQSAPEITRVYPNPVVAATSSLDFGIPTSGLTWVWAVRAVGPDDVEAEFASISGASINVPAGAPVEVLYNREHLTAGSYHADFSPFDSKGRELPSGFYRLYLHFEGDNGMVFDGMKDILLLQEWECESIPWELRELVGCW